MNSTDANKILFSSFRFLVLGAWFLVFKLEIADNEYPLFENRGQNPALTDGVVKIEQK